MDDIRWTQHRVYDGNRDSSGVTPISLWWLAIAAAEETLQGSPMTGAWLQLFQSHLSRYDDIWLRWRGDLAESTELRRAYSGLYGRFFARALLSKQLGFSRFQSLKRNGLRIPYPTFGANIEVKRIAKGDIPDWLAWDPVNARLVLCEAKGSLGANDFLVPDGPKCVTEGKKQFDRVKTTVNGVEYCAERWVAATRWATEERGGVPITVLWDPPVDELPFEQSEARRIRVAMAKGWLESIAFGFGYDGAETILSKDREKATVVVTAKSATAPELQDWPHPDPEDRELEQAARRISKKFDFSNAVSYTRELLLARQIRNPDEIIVRTPMITNHTGRYLSVLATRLGLMPIKSREDKLVLMEACRRARDLVEPGMLICLPFELDPSEMEEVIWLNRAGIAQRSGLSVFDLRLIDIEAVA